MQDRAYKRRHGEGFDAASSAKGALASGYDFRSDAEAEPQNQTLRLQEKCEALAGRTFGTATVVSAATQGASNSAPEHCLVKGLILPQLNFEVRLPSEWNQKLFFQGGGGYNGTVPAANRAVLLAGYAQVASDSGHQANSLDASFALNDPLARRLFGSVSVPTVVGPAVEIVQAGFGKAPSRKYMEGCSNGGREGLMSVQRYPHLFDGVIARAPVYNWVGTIGTEHRTSIARAATGSSFTAEKLSLLAGERSCQEQAGASISLTDQGTCRICGRNLPRTPAP